jgi:hypothetical protein
MFFKGFYKNFFDFILSYFLTQIRSKDNLENLIILYNYFLLKVDFFD